MDTKRKAILTITRNSSHIWKYFIRSFQDYCSEYDLYVWDNGSRPGDVEYLNTYVEQGVITKFFPREDNWLFTYAANELMEFASQYDQVVLVNPDIEFREGWDRDVEGNRGILGFVLVKPNGVVEHAGGFGGGDHVGRGERDTGQYQELRDVEWVTFGAVAISRGTIDTLGLLDEEYAHFGSDREYCRLAKAAGIPVKCSGARLTHYYGWACRPYEWRNIPDKIWKKHVKERHGAGVFFPQDQNRIPRIDIQYKVKAA